MRTCTLTTLFSLLLPFTAVPAFAQAQSGDLIITEYMANPDAVADDTGEYIEIYNDTESDINLNGYILRDDGTDMTTIDQDVTVPAEGFAVLARSEDPLGDGSLTPDYVFSGFELSNADDEIYLETDASPVAATTYDNGNPDGPGVAQELIDFELGRDETTTTDDYQGATNDLGNDEAGDGTGDDAGDFGSPGMQGGTIPVEFAGAPEAIVSGSDVTLKWTTLMETNSRGFYVEHLRDEATSWTTVTTLIEGAGTSTEAQPYQYTVKNLAPDSYTFRIRQSDLDGAISYSRSVTVEVISKGLALQPPSQNPFQVETMLRYSAGEEAVVNAALFNSLGQKVRMLEATDGRIVVTAAGLASGLYFLRLEAGDRVETQSITLVR